MTKRLIISLGIAALSSVTSCATLASSVNCQTIGDRAICTFSFGDDNTSKKNDILYFQCVVSPKADYHEDYSDISVDMWNTNVRSAGFEKGGKLSGLDGYAVNRLAFANKWQRNDYPQTVTIKIVKGHADLQCKSANVPTRPVFGDPQDDGNYQ